MGRSQTPKGSNTTIITGVWRVNDRGYCSKWGTNAEHCYTIEKNADKYDGEWVNGRRHGHGTMTYAIGDIYDGEWRDDKPRGKDEGRGMTDDRDVSSFIPRPSSLFWARWPSPRGESASPGA